MNPQDPYDSCIVQASAGSGKTYQLSRRYLNIVGSGVPIQKILTITFTRKAAAEMKQRIMQDAVELLNNKSRQLEFDKDNSSYFLQYQHKQKHQVRPRINAVETANIILSSTQLMKITTIDALFLEWCSKFSWEASLMGAFTSDGPQSEIADHIDSEEINKKAWKQIFLTKSVELIPNIGSRGVLGLESLIYELYRHHTYLWKIKYENQDIFFKHEVSLNSELETFLQVENEIRQVLSIIPNSDRFIEAFEKKSILGLLDKKFFNQSGEVSGILLRSKKREQLCHEILHIAKYVSLFLNSRKLETLNKNGSSILDLYFKWIKARQAIKRKLNLIEFNDLALGAYTLFHHPRAVGATWAIQSSYDHLMIDEFQDTSLLQWSVFSHFCEDILSGEAGRDLSPRSVFLVGDFKQSIYGFREADPVVVEEASDLFESFGKKTLPLHKSFRSGYTVLNFINNLFIRYIDSNFPVHSSALSEPKDVGKGVVGEITVRDECAGDDKISALEKEAYELAKYLKNMFENPSSYLVFDKKNKEYRPIKESDCVILYRNSTHSETFSKALKEMDIPFLKEDEKGFFERPEVLDIISLLRFLNSPNDIISLLSFLLSPICRIPDKTVLEILDKVNIRTSDESENNVSDELTSKAQEFLDDLVFIFPDVVDKLKKSFNDSCQYKPSLLLGEIFETWGVFLAYNIWGQQEERIVKLHLLSLWEFFIQKEKESCCSLDAMLEYVDRSILKKDKAASSLDVCNVRMMTIHKSKGLEFPFVALVESSDPWYRLDRYWVKMPEIKKITYIGTKSEHPLRDQEFDSLLDRTKFSLLKESERLLYVSLTRSSQYLYISAHTGNSSYKSSFYQMMKEVYDELCFEKNNLLTSKSKQNTKDSVSFSG